MATAEEPPLDEIQWRSPQIAQEMGGIHTNNVLHYFARSPFFDPTSNNSTLSNQALYNPNLHHIIQTRAAFEGHLQSMGGLEFMVSHDPSNNGLQHENSGVWVIRKQNRRKRQGADDEIAPLSSYFVIGENIYMAPSVGNVLGSRTLSIVTSLTKLLSTAAALPMYTPSLGHTYLPALPKTNLQATQTSKENTPMLDSDNMLKNNSKAPLLSDKSSKLNIRDINTLAGSTRLAIQYQNEYMDESPVVGEPGSFVLQKSREAPPQAQAQAQASNKTLVATKPQNSQLTSSTSPPTPAPLITDIPPAVSRKGSKLGDKTPTTPGGKEKRRKKSKVAMSPEK